MSGQLGTQFKGLIVETKEELLFKNNVSPKGPVETNVPTNDLASQTINIGYSILSEDPNKINKAIQTGKYNVKKVILTKSFDCTLRGELKEENDNKYICYWKTSDDVLPFKKVIYSGTKPNEISNNFQLWNAQLLIMDKIISNWASKTSYSGSFASPLVSLNMGDYDIIFSDPSSENETIKYKVSTCEELLRVLKTESGLPLVYIPKYEATTCFHMPWTSFNKRTILDLMISVKGINNSPVAKPRDGENYTSTLHNPDETEYVVNENAYTVYETINPTASNYIRIMNNVFVDAFEPINDVPTLLQLVFFTDFFFEMKQEEDPEDDECNSSPTLYNPDTMVSPPLESSFLK
jgi:hypothetical protein